MSPDAPLDLLATCTFGLEAVVVRELADLGYAAQPIGTGRVLFTAPPRAICEANLWLRAADRVLVRVGSFPIRAGDDGFDDLFEGVKALEWERWIGPEAGIPVSGRCVRSQLTSEPAVQRATKKAIVDRLRRVHGLSDSDTLPETGPPVRVEVAIVNDAATLTIDTSGAGLHKRGYRDAGGGANGHAGGVGMGDAALRETLAAGLVLLSVWRPTPPIRPLVDPFCGTGTIAIEAAMIGRSIAPGLNRSFDAERWLDARGHAILPLAMWDECRAEARAAIVRERLDPVIHASDTDERALRTARACARAAGHNIEHDIQFIHRDVADLSSNKPHGVIVTNPPYGVRLGDDRDIEALYRSLPAIFRALPTWTFHILSGRLDLESLFGQPATRRRKLYNSKIETAYFTFLGPRPAGTPRRGAEDAEQNENQLQEGDSGLDQQSRASIAQQDDTSIEDEDDQSIQAQGGTGILMPVVTRATEALLHPAPPTPPSPPRPSAPPNPPRSLPAFGGLSDREHRESEDFGRCLAGNLRHLRKYPSRGIFCYRVYDRDVTDVPLIIDRYESESGNAWFHAAEYERPHQRSAAQQADWFDLMRSTIASAAGVPPARVILKEKHRQRGLSQHEKLSGGGRTLIVRESDLRFEVNLEDYIDTGLFLDHRLTRDMVRKESAGKRVLNLFCYTGAFTVHAAAGGGGGATSSVSVDLSHTYLDWTRRNLGLNNLYATSHELIRADAMAWLRDASSSPTRMPFDLAIVDPPTFSNSKSTEQDWDVQTAHAELLTLLVPLLAPRAIVYFSTNFRQFKLHEPAVQAAGYTIREISHRTIPPEYRNKRIHRCWRLLHTEPPR